VLEEIPNLPQTFMDRHMNWHTMTPPDGRTIPKGQPGSGAEFLDFHHQFISDVKSWYAAQPGADPSKLVAWTAFPNDLAAAHSPELVNYAAYAGKASNFTSEDALGIYVEHEHDFVHGYIADLYDTPAFNSFDSCMFFLFYQWHGLIDAWRGNWLVHHKSAIKDAIDVKRVLKDVIDHKRTIKDVLDSHPGGIKALRDGLQVPQVPPKTPKELAEVPGGGKEVAEVPGGVATDPVAQLEDRMARLEGIVHRQAFIRGEERPEVD
jgi:hypothetical protein